MKNSKKIISKSKKQLFSLATIVCILLIIGMSMIYASTNYNKTNATIGGEDKYAKTALTAGGTASVHRRRIKSTSVSKSNPIKLGVKTQYSTIYDEYGMISVFTIDDLYAYCIQLGVSVNIDDGKSGTKNLVNKNNSTYWTGLSTVAKNGISNVLTYGYPNNSSAGTGDDAYIATQTLIWEFQQGWRTNYNLTPSNTEIYDRWIKNNSNVKAIYEKILTSISNGTTMPSFTSSSSLTIKYNSTSGNYEGSLTDSNKVLSTVNIKCSGNITCTVTGNTLNVTSSKSLTGTETITVSKKSPSDISQSLLILEKDSDQRLAVGRDPAADTTKTINVSTSGVGGGSDTSVETKGTLVVGKLVTNGKDGYKNQEFSFEVSGPNSYSKTFKLKAGSQEKLTNLETGWYTVKEVNVPNGYKVVGLSTKIFYISKYTPYGLLIFTNAGEDERAVTITKTDENGNILPGATLTIKNKTTNVVLKRFTTTNEPIIFSAEDISLVAKLDVANILKGSLTFSVCEETAPTGYEKNEECQDFKFTTSNPYPTVSLVNYKATVVEETSIIVNKVDSKGNILKGAHLQLKNPKGIVVEEWDESTHTLTTKITESGYTIVETKAPEGYMIANSVSVPIPTQKGTIVQVVNKPIQLSISKRDTNSGELLSGSHLQLIDSNSNIVDEWDTTNEIHLINSGLKAGETYILKETVTPKGYLQAQNLTISIDEKGSIQSEIAMYDNPIVSVPDTDISVNQIIMIAGCVLILVGSIGVAFILKKRGALE